MKVKEINRTANVAWSPSQQYPIYLAAGTAAQQLDATFSTTAALEIFHLDFNSHEIEMPLVGSLPCEHRFNKLIWGNYGIIEEEYDAGVVIGGTDQGDILVVDASKIISGSTDDPVVQSIDQHTGPVHGLDINPFQTNLLASGGTGSEIYVLDLKNPSTPLSPGNKSLQPDVITCVAWNKTVHHILGTASPGIGKVIVWDLRKNEPVIKVGDASSLMRCKSMAWHPEVATQMVIANEDDRYPVIQMWDLRFATSPMKIFEGHQRGVLSLAWCAQDPDLLMSCGKDNRILCFNPNSDIPGGEILYELQTSSQWTFDVLWCPRNPGLISTTSFDGHVTVNSLLGGGTAPHTTQDQVMDAFGDTDLGTLPAHLQQQRQQQQQQHQRSEPLKKTPRWMKKPCAARFGFGGKLISFGNFNESPAKQIYVSQVITEEEFLNRSVTLENALLAGQFVEFCEHKINTATDSMDKSLWSFLKVNFDKEPRLKFLDLLGYNPQELAKKICALTSIPKSPSGSRDSAVDAKELASKMELLSSTGDHLLKADGGLFSSGSVSPSGAGTKRAKLNKLLYSTRAWTKLAKRAPDPRHVVFTGIRCHLHVGPLKTPASDNEGAAAFDAIAATGAIPPVGSADPSNDEGRPASPLTISTEDDTDGLVSQSLLTGNFEAAVDVCFKANRMADALLLGIAGGPELFTRTQNRYLEQAKTAVSRLISSVVNRDWRSIVETCAIDSWREALAALITYAKAEEFSDLCDVLGERLEAEDRQFSSAMVCYICGGNVERMVACWSRSIKQEPSALTLQDLVEKLMILKKAVEREQKDTVNSPDSYLSKQISNYANILASQGCYQTAMAYLSTVSDPSVAVLKDRVFRAQNVNQLGVAGPEPPFGKVEILAAPAPKPSQEKVQPSHRQMPRTGAPYQSQFAPQPQGPQLFDPPNAPQNPLQPPRPNYAGPPQPGYISSSPNVPTPPASIGGQAIFTPAQASHAQPQPPYQPVASQGYGLYNPVVPAPTGLPPPLSGDSFVNAPAISAPGANFTPSPPGQRPNLTNLYNPSAMQNNYGGSALPQGPPLSTHMQPTPMPPMQSQPTPGIPPPAGPPTPYGMPDMGAPAVGPPPGKFVPGYHHLARESPTQAQPQPLPAGMFVPSQTQIPPEEKKLPPEPEPKNVMKPPIPSEHMVVQEVLNAMVDRCKSSVNNPQTKRKLEEVTRRLEILYDMLRDSKLSPNVLGGLHQMVDACKVNDYSTGLQIHTQMVASGNFSEISSFMSGLKTLMQVATQLRV